MGLTDDLRAETPREELSRREALGKITGVSLGIAGLGTVFTTVRYLKPNVLFEPPTRFRVGRPEDIPIGTLLVLPEQKLYVAHTQEGFFALSAECTHLGCMTRWLPDQETIACPCHGSKFAPNGVVKAGPAPIPLRRMHLSLADSELIVDTRRTVGDDFVLRA
ncbi:MAG: ubiquinol-cytochrome c reductase iron-sulfur subunit [Acidobacteriota bacterium]|jgi:cytochrome b6-f complex iron-sulfur subunit